jgi:ADP-heptose:LPS heptosyltransferase
MAWLKQELKPEWFEIWTERINVPIAESPGYADRAVAMADTGIERYPIPESLYQRLQAFDLVLSWKAICDPSASQRHPNLHFLSPWPNDNCLHVADFRRAQLEKLLRIRSSGDSAYPEIRCSPEELYVAKQFLNDDRGKEVAVIHPGASSGRKRWTAVGFATVATRLARSGLRVFLAEGPADSRAVKEVESAGRALEPQAELRRLRLENLRQLSAVLSLCGLYVGNDSGITHLAAASGTCTLAIFTVTNPKVWAPRGPDVHVCINPTIDEVCCETERLCTRKIPAAVF